MDDFNIPALTESRNSYTNLLISKLTPQICQGLESLFQDTYRLCEENDEETKCLMTFQNVLARIPSWNQTLVEEEVNRIIQECNCSYLEDLLTCVHITQLKILTSVRVGQKQKEIEIDVPSIHTFVHNVYKYCARVLYKNVYLYDINVMPIEKQKNKKEIETIVKDEIVNVIRSSMPIESILKAYLDETTEQYEQDIESNEQRKIEEMVRDKNVDNQEESTVSNSVSPSISNESSITTNDKDSTTPSTTFVNSSPKPNVSLNNVALSDSNVVSSMSLSPSNSQDKIQRSPIHSTPVSILTPTPTPSPITSPSNKAIHTEKETQHAFIGSKMPELIENSIEEIDDLASDGGSDIGSDYGPLNIDNSSSISLSGVNNIVSPVSNKKSLLNMDDIQVLH